MKKKLLTILFAGSIAAGFAQAPSITSASSFKAGESQVSYFADTVGIMPGSAGENVTWDFSQLQRLASNDSVISNYYAASSTVYAEDFPNANLATNSASGGAFAYYNSTDTKLEMHGIVAQQQGVTVKQFYSNPHVMYTLPMTYNYDFSDDFSGSYTVNGINVFRTGTSDVDADGYGTLKIGDRTFTDVLRLHNITQTRDSSNFGVTSIVTVADVESWFYMTPTKKEPLLTIMHTTSTNSQTGTVVRSKAVTYNNKVVSTSVKEKAKVFSGVSLYPNPANDNCRIVFKAENSLQANIQLVNQVGQSVKSVKSYTIMPGENIINLDLEDLASGLYYLQVRTADGMHVEKLVKN